MLECFFAGLFQHPANPESFQEHNSVSLYLQETDIADIHITTAIIHRRPIKVDLVIRLGDG